MPEQNGDPDYQPRPGDSNIPVPDPSRLTTQLVDRALAAFREVIDTRLRAMDRATELIATALEKFQVDTVAMHAHLKDDRHSELASVRELILSRVDLVDKVSVERFTAIATQFTERDTRTQQAADESRISLDAALAAAKEAVSEQNKANALAIGKSEDATKERLDALALLMTTSTGSLDDKISDVKSRLDRGEGRTTGATENRTESRSAMSASSGLIFGLIGAFVGLAGIGFAIVSALAP